MNNAEAWKKLRQGVADEMNKDVEFENAVKALQDIGIISSPEVWIKGEYSKNNVRSLIMKFVNYIR